MLAGLPGAPEKRWLLSLDRLEIPRREVRVSTASQVCKRKFRSGGPSPTIPRNEGAGGMTEESKCFHDIGCRWGNGDRRSNHPGSTLGVTSFDGCQLFNRSLPYVEGGADEKGTRL
jgi:hypothetical protein